MSYAKAYSMSAASTNELTTIIYGVEIWEKDFAGYEATFDPANNPLTGQILANSDDPFDPILTSTITLLIDTTDFTGTLPDVTSFDDRKYWVKVYANNPTYYVWQGFILMQGGSLPFTTGRTFLQLVCVDGLALLNDIPYVPTTVDNNINTTEDLSTIITNCLNLIQLPDGYNINYAVGIYDSGMNTNISVFKQSYFAPRNWLNSDLTYKTCFEVLQIIMLGFAAQIYQSNGEWWVGNVNDRATDFIQYFTTTDANGVETKTTMGKMREIKPYLNETDTPWFFQDNAQAKILRKGYPTIELIHTCGFAAQCIDNGTMTRLSGGFPVNWVPSSTGSVTATSLGPYNAIALAPTGGGPTQRVASVAALSSAPANQGDEINLSFWIDGNVPPSTTVPKCNLRILLQGPSPSFTTYWLDETNNWQLQVGPDPVPEDRFYPIIGNTSAVYESISVTTPAMPITGSLFFGWYTDNFDTEACTIANVVMTFSFPYSSQKVTSKVYADSNYKKTVNIQIGAQSNNDTSEIGALLNSAGAILTNWYRSGVTEGYFNLMRLIAQQYTNVLSKAQINFSMTVRGLYDNRFELGPVLKRRAHIIGLADVVTVNDTTTDSFTVDGKYYITGSADINYTDDTLNGTLLETSNVDLTSVFTDQLITKQ